MKCKICKKVLKFSNKNGYCLRHRFHSPKRKLVMKEYRKTLNYKTAQIKSHLKRKFKISIDVYQALWQSQNGVCAICNQKSGKRSLAVDHNHETGNIRGLLCFKCNMALGYLKENKDILYNMIDYLDRHEI